jgi:ATP-dependent helicase HrpA
MSGIEIAAGDFAEQALPVHLRMRIEVLGEDGEALAAGRDLAELQERFGPVAQQQFMRREGAGMVVDGARDWVFGRLGDRVETASGVSAWPALVDQQDAVGLRLFDIAGEAVMAHGAGVLRLIELALAEKLSYLRRQPGLSRASQLAWSAWGPVGELVDDLVRSSLAQAAGEVWSIRDPDAFAQRLEQVRSDIGPACRRQADLLNGMLPLCARIVCDLPHAVTPRWPEAAADVGQQLADLVYPGFLGELQPGRLEHYPRYLAAIEERLRQLEENPRRDRQRASQVAPWWQRYVDRLAAGGPYDAALDAYRWQLEEFRVSVFAQQLSTAEKISAKRLAGSWQRVLDTGAAA